MIWKDSDINKWFESKPAVKQFIKFCVIGVFNTFTDLVIYIFFTRVVGWHYTGAAIIAFALAATLSFLLNKYWTFKVNNNKFTSEYFRFILVATGGLLWTLLFMYIMIDLLHWYDILAKVITIIVVVNWNFWLQKHWTFKVK